MCAAPALPKVDRGQGSFVYDRDGKRYLDGSGGPAVFCLGHAHPEVNAAIIAQLDKIAHGYRYTFTSDPLEELQALMRAFAGGSLAHSVIVTGGSEAVESCLKIALQYQSAIGAKSRRHFISRQRSWHGNTLGALSISGFQYRLEPFEGALIPSTKISPVNAYRPPEGVAPEDLAAHAAQELEEAIVRQGAETVCAFVFEPVVGAAGGAVPAPAGYAKRVREICDRHGVLMIADEVMCGTGRCGTWRALEHDGVEPDIMAVAKGLGAGYVPLGAALFSTPVQQGILSHYPEILTGHTFAGHTLACAAGAAVQGIIKRDKLVERVADKGAWLMDSLKDALGQHPHVGDIRGRGFFIGLEFVKDRESKEPFDPDLKVFARLRESAFSRGLICYPTGGNVDGVKGDQCIIAPPYNASDEELNLLVELLNDSVKAALTF